MNAETGRTDARHVLIVCYDFPGIWAAGVIRTYQLAKELMSFGWKPVILTAQTFSAERDDSIEKYDGSLNCPVFPIPPARFLVPYEVNHNVMGRPFDLVVPNGNGPLRRILGYVSRLAVPDGKIGWVLPAAKRGLRIAQDHRIDLCFSVSPRRSSHFVAKRVARALGVPWVADFSLEWLDGYGLFERPSLITWLDRHLEASVVRSAGHISVAYPDIARDICARFGEAWREKISVIPTGFPEDLFHGTSAAASAKFTILYPGNHFCEEGRHGESFLQALDEWAGADASVRDCVEFVSIGKRDEALLRRHAAMVHPQMVRVEPLIPHRACIEAIQSTDICVVNAVGNRIPCKVYECMRAEKPVLALTDPDSDLASLMNRYPRGTSVTPQDVSGIRNALQELYQTGRSDKAERIKMDSFLAAHSTKRSAEKL